MVVVGPGIPLAVVAAFYNYNHTFVPLPLPHFGARIMQSRKGSEDRSAAYEASQTLNLALENIVEDEVSWRNMITTFPPTERATRKPGALPACSPIQEQDEIVLLRPSPVETARPLRSPTEDSSRPASTALSTTSYESRNPYDDDYRYQTASTAPRHTG